MSEAIESIKHVSHVNEIPAEIPAMAATKAGVVVEKWAYKPKNATADDVDFVVTHCGLCHSDVHTINDDWGVLKPGKPDTMLPLVPGHEVVGRVTRVGDNASAAGFKVGDVVGLGAQAYKCASCDLCTTGDDNACASKRMTYSHKFTDEANPEPVQHYGGFSAALRTHFNMLFKIPEGLDPTIVGPLLCAGITTYAPLEDLGAAPGKKVGVLGVGGLGHLAVQFSSRAFGAETVAISRGTKKRDMCMQLGATSFLDSTDEEEVKKHLGTFDILLVTAAGGSFDIAKHLAWCKPKRGKIHIVGAIDEPMQIAAFPLILAGGVSISGSLLGSSEQMVRMLGVCKDKGIKPMIETFPHSRANEAIDKMLKNELMFRAVLINDLL